MTKIFKAASDLTLDSQDTFIDKVAKGNFYMEDNVLHVTGESEEGDYVSLVSGIYRVGGGRNGPWQIDDGFQYQTTFLAVPLEQTRGGMKDNDFISNRIWATDHWQGCKITKTQDSIAWAMGKQVMVCRPPYWELRGEHMGVECDLVFYGVGDAIFHKGKPEDYAKHGIAGWEQPMIAEGTIKANGKTHTLKKENTSANQEKFMQPGWDLAKVLTGETYYWMFLANETTHMQIYSYPQMGTSFSHVSVNGKKIDFSENGKSNIKMEELEYWIDPKTRMRVPVKWHFNMQSKNAVIDLDISAFARTLYSYLSESGATIHNGMHSRSEGKIAFPDGRTIPLNNLRSYVEHGWSAIPLPAAAC